MEDETDAENYPGSDRYRVVKVVGRGSCGVCYLAEDLRDGNRLVVIKKVSLISTAPASVASARDAFAEQLQAALNEVQLLQSIDHPNVIKYQGSYIEEKVNTTSIAIPVMSGHFASLGTTKKTITVEQVVNMVMEFADGGDLWTEIQRRQRNIVMDSDRLARNNFDGLLSDTYQLRNTDQRLFGDRGAPGDRGWFNNLGLLAEGRINKLNSRTNGRARLESDGTAGSYRNANWLSGDAGSEGARSPSGLSRQMGFPPISDQIIEEEPATIGSHLIRAGSRSYKLAKHENENRMTQGPDRGSIRSSDWFVRAAEGGPAEGSLENVMNFGGRVESGLQQGTYLQPSVRVQSVSRMDLTARREHDGRPLLEFSGLLTGEVVCPRGSRILSTDSLGAGLYDPSLLENPSATNHSAHNHSANRALKSAGYLESMEFWLISIQMLLGLRYIHGHRVIHRDLKPSNIFMTGDGLIKLGDFGIKVFFWDPNSPHPYLNYDDSRAGDGSRSVFDGSREESLRPDGLRADQGRKIRRVRRRNFFFSPPEILLSEDKQGFDQKSDIWSLGCLLFKIITLFYHPFQILVNPPSEPRRGKTEPYSGTRDVTPEPNSPDPEHATGRRSEGHGNPGDGHRGLSTYEDGYRAGPAERTGIHHNDLFHEDRDFMNGDLRKAHLEAELSASDLWSGIGSSSQWKQTEWTCTQPEDPGGTNPKDEVVPSRESGARGGKRKDQAKLDALDGSRPEERGRMEGRGGPEEGRGEDKRDENRRFEDRAQSQEGRRPAFQGSSNGFAEFYQQVLSYKSDPQPFQKFWSEALTQTPLKNDGSDKTVSSILRMMLQVNPEDRPSASQILSSIAVLRAFKEVVEFFGPATHPQFAHLHNFWTNTAARRLTRLERNPVKPRIKKVDNSPNQTTTASPTKADNTPVTEGGMVAVQRRKRAVVTTRIVKTTRRKPEPERLADKRQDSEADQSTGSEMRNVVHIVQEQETIEKGSTTIQNFMLSPRLVEATSVHRLSVINHTSRNVKAPVTLSRPEEFATDFLNGFSRRERERQNMERCLTALVSSIRAGSSTKFFEASEFRSADSQNQPDPRPLRQPENEVLSRVDGKKTKKIVQRPRAGTLEDMGPIRPCSHVPTKSLHHLPRSSRTGGMLISSSTNQFKDIMSVMPASPNNGTWIELPSAPASVMEEFRTKTQDQRNPLFQNLLARKISMRRDDPDRWGDVCIGKDTSESTRRLTVGSTQRRRNAWETDAHPPRQLPTRFEQEFQTEGFQTFANDDLSSASAHRVMISSNSDVESDVCSSSLITTPPQGLNTPSVALTPPAELAVPPSLQTASAAMNTSPLAPCASPPFPGGIGLQAPANPSVMSPNSDGQCRGSAPHTMMALISPRQRVPLTARVGDERALESHKRTASNTQLISGKQSMVDRLRQNLAGQVFGSVPFGQKMDQTEETFPDGSERRRALVRSSMGPSTSVSRAARTPSPPSPRTANRPPSPRSLVRRPASPKGRPSPDAWLPAIALGREARRTAKPSMSRPPKASPRGKVSELS